MQCIECGCPIEIKAFFVGLGYVGICYCCAEMWKVAASSSYMVDRHNEWVEEQQKKRELIRGD